MLNKNIANFKDRLEFKRLIRKYHYQLPLDYALNKDFCFMAKEYGLMLPNGSCKRPFWYDYYMLYRETIACWLFTRFNR